MDTSYVRCTSRHSTRPVTISQLEIQRRSFYNVDSRCLIRGGCKHDIINDPTTKMMLGLYDADTIGQ